jgi:hypothetical protein
MKIRTVGAELFHADGQTDDANISFSQFCASASKGFFKNISHRMRNLTQDLAKLRHTDKHRPLKEGPRCDNVMHGKEEKCIHCSGKKS